MADQSPVLIRSAPGIKRDGTLFEGENYVDGQWSRFQRGLPRKMGGYQGVTSNIPEISRGLDSFAADSILYLHTAGVDFLTQVQVSQMGVFLALNDRTPGTYSPNADSLWQFTTMFDSVTAQTRLIAHPGANLSAIDNTLQTPIYYGKANAVAALTDTGVASESGGIVALNPYLMKFGNNGHIAWSVPNKPNDFTNAGSGDAFVTGQKIVKGLKLRGGQAGPAGIFWSLDSVVVGNFVGGTPIWAFNEVEGDSSSILSSQGPILYDGIYYWPGVDRFLMFNGVVRELPNQMNVNWFFDNLNFAQRQKVFVMKVTRFGEIWWAYPRGNATECTHAVVYNVRENTWYDTQLPDSGRSSGIYAKVYNKPFMIDLDETSSGFTLWQHETGTDRILGSNIRAVQSFIETNEITMLESDPPKDASLRISRIEPDFIQAGDMTVTVKGRANAKAPDVSSETKTFTPGETADPALQTVPFKDVRRLMRFRFESNVVGGDYQMGNVFGHIGSSDGRLTS